MSMTNLDSTISDVLTMGASVKIGDAVFNPARRTVTFAGKTRALEPRLVELLERLIRSEGAARRETLLDEVWGFDGSDEALTQAISKLRRALGDTQRPHRIIETVPKQGYRLCAPVETATEAAGVISTDSMPSFLHSAHSHAIKRREFYTGAAFGAAVILTGLALITVLGPPRDIDQDIECPDSWSAADCIDVIKAIKP